MTRQRIIFIIAGICVLLIGLIVFLVYQNAQLHVTHSEPNDRGVLNIGSSIFIEYSGDIRDDMTITTSPQFGFAKKIEGNRLIITPVPTLTKDKSYSLTLSHVHAKDSATSGGTDYQLHFTSGIVPFDQLPPSQYKEQTSSIDSQYKKAPILSILPVSQLNFTITSATINDKVYVIITPTVTPTGKTESEYTTQYNDYYNQATAYLKQKGYGTSDSSYIIMNDRDFKQLDSASDQNGSIRGD